MFIIIGAFSIYLKNMLLCFANWFVEKIGINSEHQDIAIFAYLMILYY
jgi:hypothetical protein